LSSGGLRVCGRVQTCLRQGCQMVYFKIKKSHFGYILKGLGMENVVCFTAIWYNLWSFGKLMAIWYNLWPFGTVCGHLV
jgi:hypothetical protein